MAPASLSKPRSRTLRPQSTARTVAAKALGKVNGKANGKANGKPSTPATKKKRRIIREAKLSKTTKPAALTLEDWQRELRKQFGSEQKFKLSNVGDHTVFSEFLVTNPDSKNT